MTDEERPRGRSIADEVEEGEVRKIVGFGNPLLDISCEVSQAVLDDWGVQTNNAILAEDKHKPKYAELSAQFKEKVDFIAGGATLNSIRVAQWLLTGADKGQCTSFIGCIGKDAFGEKMKEQLTTDKVAPFFLEDVEVPTGTCAVLIKDNERSLIANLSAAEKYDIEHFKSAPVQACVEAAEIFYMAGFPITHPGGGATVKAICEHATASRGKIVCMNLSAPFLVQVPPFREALLEAIKFCNYVFCNESEAEALGAALEWEEKSVDAIAVRMASLPSEKAWGLTVVVTQGSSATIVAQSPNPACPDGVMLQFPVAGNPWTLAKEQLVDTNGAGDAFVGGFLSQLAVRTDEAHGGLAECVRMGHFAAGCIIQQSGCTCPDINSVKSVFGDD